MNLKRMFASVFSFIFVLPISSATGGQPASTAAASSPEKVVSRLLSLRHGLLRRTMDNETEALLDAVLANPAPYADAIAVALDLPEDEARIGTTAGLHRVSCAITLAKMIGHEHAAPMVHRFFDKVSNRVVQYRSHAEDSDARKQVYRNILLLQNWTLDALGEFGDRYAIDECVKTVGSIETEKGDLASQVVMLRYLEKVAPLRPDIRPKLAEMYQSRASRLRNNPQLQRVLEAIDRAEADKTDTKNK